MHNNIVELVKSQISPFVIPRLDRGIQYFQLLIDSRPRIKYGAGSNSGNDVFGTFYEFIKIKSPSLLIAAVSTILVLSSCTYDKEFERANNRMSDLNTRIAGVEENLDDRLNTINTHQAEMLVELESIKQSIKELSNRVEDNERLIQHSYEKELSEQDSSKIQLSELAGVSQKIDLIENYLKLHHEYLGLEPMEMPEGPSEDLTRAEDFPEDMTEGTENKPRDKALYDTSLALFNNRQYSRAVNGFKTLLEEFPKSDLADNAQFWIGESFMALKQYDMAIRAFQDVIEKYPKENKTPNAMYRQAIAWLEIGDKTSAEIILKNIIKQYPGSNEAKLAQKKLGAIK